MELSDLPSIDALAAELSHAFELPAPIITDAARRAVDTSRVELRSGRDADPTGIATALLTDVAAARPRRVINATGVLLHTNLGRAPVAIATADTAGMILTGTSNVEIDVRTGRRSKRHDYLDTLIPLVTEAEAGFAVNNNAGALLLALASVAGNGGRVAVSRGELIEIGGSFRLPDLMAASGAELVEVGTTNRTRAADYASVVDTVDAILKVHPSNYRIDGFSQETTYGELAELAAQNGVSFIADVGSGLIDEQAPWLSGCDRSWLAGEPGVIQTIRTGADLVLFSGDKLFGGPQGGIIVGKTEAVTRAKKHPIARAVRLDGSSLAAIASTFELYAGQRISQIPFWSMVCATLDEIESRSQAVIDGIDEAISIVDGASIPGAGSAPGATIPTRLIRLDGDADRSWSKLAQAPTPVIASRRDGSVYIDLRSVLPGDDVAVRAALISAIA
ncbi:MAG: L-seryl-tRNA(Sec) selenium transferase [Actinomycetota bacterium]